MTRTRVYPGPVSIKGRRRGERQNRGGAQKSTPTPPRRSVNRQPPSALLACAIAVARPSLSRFVAAGTIRRGSRSIVCRACCPAITAVCLIRTSDHERGAALAARGVETQTGVIRIIGQSIVARGHWHLDILGFTVIDDAIIDAIARRKRPPHPPLELVEPRLPTVRVARPCRVRTGREKRIDASDQPREFGKRVPQLRRAGRSGTVLFEAPHTNGVPPTGSPIITIKVSRIGESPLW